MVQWTRWIVKHVADEMNVTWDVFYGWLYRFPYPRFNRSHLALGYVLLCGEFNVNFFYIFLFIISPEDQLIMDPFNLIPNRFVFCFYRTYSPNKRTHSANTMSFWVNDNHSQGSPAESRRKVQWHDLPKGSVQELYVLVRVQVCVIW